MRRTWRTMAPLPQRPGAIPGKDVSGPSLAILIVCNDPLDPRTEDSRLPQPRQGARMDAASQLAQRWIAVHATAICSGLFPCERLAQRRRRSGEQRGARVAWSRTFCGARRGFLSTRCGFRAGTARREKRLAPAFVGGDVEHDFVDQARRRWRHRCGARAAAQACEMRQDTCVAVRAEQLCATWKNASTKPSSAGSSAVVATMTARLDTTVRSRRMRRKPAFAKRYFIQYGSVASGWPDCIVGYA